MILDVPDSSQEPQCHPRLQPGEVGQTKSDFENSNDYHYLNDLRNHPKCVLMLLTPLRNLHVTQDSNLAFLVKTSLILKIPTILYMI